MAGSLRRKFKAIDDRTGRLVRAIDLLEDGQNPKIKTTAANRDKFNPQSVTRRVPLDRVNLKGGAFVPEVQSGYTRIDVGWIGNVGSNFERQGIPSVTTNTNWGTYTYTYGFGVDSGYGSMGYGFFGYGGDISSETDGEGRY